MGSPGRAWLAAALLAGVLAVVALVHGPALSARALILDDAEVFTRNPLVRTPGLHSAWRFVSEVWQPSSVLGYYQPLTMISLMIDYALGARPENPTVARVTSLTLHLIACGLVFVLMRRLFDDPLAAAAAALLFGLHPIAVEPVAWLAQRKTLLSTVFALMSLIAYVRYARAPSSAPGAAGPSDGGALALDGSGSRGRAAFSASVVFLALALLCKPAVLPVPILMLILDAWPLKRIGVRAVVEKWPMYAVAAVGLVVGVISNAPTVGFVTPDERGLLATLLLVSRKVAWWMTTALWPANLTTYYPAPRPLELSNPDMTAGVVGAVVIVGVGLASLRFARPVAAGLAFFYAALFPVIGVVGYSPVYAFDSYGYLPLVGLLLPAAWGLSALRSAPRVNRKVAGGVAAAAVLVLGGAYALADRAYLGTWRDSESRYRYMISRAPRSPVLPMSLATHLREQGRREEALEGYRRTLEMNPAYADANFNLGTLLIEDGDAEAGQRHLRLALESDENHFLANLNLGRHLAARGQPADALAHLERAVRRHPRHTEALFALAMVQGAMQRYDEAAANLERVVQLDPRDVQARYRLALLRVVQGRPADAVALLLRVLELQPANTAARLALGDALRAQGNLGEALKVYRTAAESDPGRADAWFALGMALRLAGQEADAERALRRALAIDPEHPGARQALP